MKKNTAVIGFQWGDEGKGKLVDIISEVFDCIVRAQGGHNAGHTVWVGEKRYALHLIPSGILRPGKKCYLGNGMVVDPTVLVKEIEQFDCADRLFISDRAHFIMPWHSAIEQAKGGHYGPGKIGTTGMGIGPAYEDKAGRRNFRLGEILNPERLRRRIQQSLGEQTSRLLSMGGRFLHTSCVDEFMGAATKLAPFVWDTRRMLDEALSAGESVLVEGAQAHSLDMDHGTFPYVTSSNPTIGGLITGTGIASRHIQNVLGVVKAYTTKVGGGPFPTCDEGEAGKHMFAVGEEKGTSTGRDRSCGSFDAVQVREAVMVNGADALAVMKLDVLSGLPELKICHAYELEGREINEIPADAEDYARCKPIYQTLPGWQEDISAVRSFRDLPENAKGYLEALRKQCGGIPLKIIGVGAERREVIIREEETALPWADSLLDGVPA